MNSSSNGECSNQIIERIQNTQWVTATAYETNFSTIYDTISNTVTQTETATVNETSTLTQIQTALSDGTTCISVVTEKTTVVATATATATATVTVTVTATATGAARSDAGTTLIGPESNITETVTQMVPTIVTLTETETVNEVSTLTQIETATSSNCTLRISAVTETSTVVTTFTDTVRNAVATTSFEGQSTITEKVTQTVPTTIVQNGSATIFDTTIITPTTVIVSAPKKRSVLTVYLNMTTTALNQGTGPITETITVTNDHIVTIPYTVNHVGSPNTVQMVSTVTTTYTETADGSCAATKTVTETSAVSGETPDIASSTSTVNAVVTANLSILTTRLTQPVAQPDMAPLTTTAIFLTTQTSHDATSLNSPVNLMGPSTLSHNTASEVLISNITVGTTNTALTTPTGQLSTSSFTSRLPTDETKSDHIYPASHGNANSTTPLQPPVVTVTSTTSYGSGAFYPTTSGVQGSSTIAPTRNSAQSLPPSYSITDIQITSNPSILPQNSAIKPKSRQLYFILPLLFLL